jgi:hypothetical protein
MSEENIVEFDKAKRSHAFARSEGKVKAMRDAFREAREEANPKLKLLKSKSGKKKSRKKSGKKKR